MEMDTTLDGDLRERVGSEPGEARPHAQGALTTRGMQIH
jgi:hypothetical protein